MNLIFAAVSLLALNSHAAFVPSPRWLAETNDENSLVLGHDAAKGIVTTAPREYMTVIGFKAGANATWANRPTFIGYEAGFNALAGSCSVMVGTAAGAHATNAWGGTFLGYAAGRYSSESAESVMVGLDSGRHAIHALKSTFIGTTSGIMANGAHESVLVGYGAGRTNRAAKVVMIGSQVGNNSTNDSEVVYVGYSAGQVFPSATITNTVAIGSRAKATTSNQVVLGNTNVTSTVLYGRVRMTSPKVPANARAVGQPGEMAWDAGFIYLCVGTNTWKRAALSDW